MSGRISKLITEYSELYDNDVIGVEARSGCIEKSNSDVHDSESS